MKRVIALLLTVVTILGCCAALVGCDDGPSAKEKYGMDYYDRADGKRIWYYTK